MATAAAAPTTAVAVTQHPERSSIRHVVPSSTSPPGSSPSSVSTGHAGLGQALHSAKGPDRNPISTNQQARELGPNPSLSSSSSSARHNSGIGPAATQQQTPADSFSHEGRTASPTANYRQIGHQGSLPTSKIFSGGIFAAALDKTQAALSSLHLSSSRSIRQRASVSTLGRVPSAAASALSVSDFEREARYRASNNASPVSTAASIFTVDATDAAPVQDLPSQPYSETDPNRPPPIRLPRNDNKMHQTSSRLLRMTDDDRPFSKVCNGLWFVVLGSFFFFFFLFFLQISAWSMLQLHRSIYAVPGRCLSGGGDIYPV